MEYPGIPRIYAELREPSPYRIPRYLMQVPTEVRKYGGEKFRRNSKDTEGSTLTSPMIDRPSVA